MSGLRWKTLFYEGIIPVLRTRSVESADAWLRFIGSLTAQLWQPWGQQLKRAERRAGEVLGRELGAAFRDRLAEEAMCALARDYLPDSLEDRHCDERFDVEGFEHVLGGISAGRGLILVGSHLGAYLPALHWLYRQDLPLRSMIQRPSHISATLRQRLDRAESRHAQQGLFLHRNLSRAEAAGVMLRARALLREGMALHVCGDIPGPTGREVDWLGRRWRILDHWAQLASITGAAVVPVEAARQPGGRFRIRFDEPRRVAPNRVDSAVSWYLQRLEAQVRDRPEQAVAYWCWPSYTPPRDLVRTPIRACRSHSALAPRHRPILAR